MTADRPPRPLTVFREPGILRGVAFMALGTVCAALVNALVRLVAVGMHPFEIAFFRAVFGSLAFATVLVRSGLAPLRARRVGLLLVRSVLQVASILCFFLGLTLIPLAKVTALNFTAPLFGTLLAALVLGEALRLRRLAALAAGFLGAAVILRPGLEGLDAGTVLVLLSALMTGVITLVVKVLLRTESSLTLTLYTALFSTPMALVAAIPVWTWPNAEQLAWLAVIGALSSLNHYLFARSLNEAEVTAVLPVEFTKLIWAALLGFALFAEVPDGWTLIGATMIFSAVVYIAVRERKLAPGRRVPESEADRTA